MTTARRFRRFHLIATAFWAIMLIPTVLWWHDSILWVAGCSLYANAATHFGAYQASRAEVASVTADTANVEADTVNVEGKSS